MLKTTTVLSKGTLAQRDGFNPETIRFYESKGLLVASGRTHSDCRQFDEEHVKKLAFIKRSQELGFSLQEIKELLSLKSKPLGGSSRIKRLRARMI